MTLMDFASIVLIVKYARFESPNGALAIAQGNALCCRLNVKSQPQRGASTTRMIEIANMPNAPAPSGLHSPYWAIHRTFFASLFQKVSKAFSERLALC
jgi:hypothetical protein